MSVAIVRVYLTSTGVVIPKHFFTDEELSWDDQNTEGVIPARFKALKSALGQTLDISFNEVYGDPDGYDLRFSVHPEDTSLRQHVEFLVLDLSDAQRELMRMEFPRIFARIFGVQVEVITISSIDQDPDNFLLPRLYFKVPGNPGEAVFKEIERLLAGHFGAGSEFRFIFD